MDLVTTLVNGTQLTVVVDASLRTNLVKVNITVYTPGPDGGTSVPLVLEIEAIKVFIPFVSRGN